MSPLLAILAAGPAFAGEISVVGDLVRQNTLAPGEHAENVILVRNNDDVPRDVIVHPNDYHFDAAGRNDYAEPGTLPRSNSRWIRFSPNQTTIAAHATASIYYTVDVPPEPELQGTFWSLLMVEALPLPEDDTGRDPDRGVKIDTVIRYGVEMITEVGTPANPKLEFQASELRHVDGHTLLALDIGNTGDTQLTPRVWIDVLDERGANRGRFEARRSSRLLPGCSSRYTLDLTSLPAGRYSGLVIAEAGADRVFGSEYALDLR